MKSQKMKPTAIVGVVLVIIGIVIIALLALATIGILSQMSRDYIRNLFDSKYVVIVLGIVFGIPVVACILPGNHLVKSANKKNENFSLLNDLDL